MIKYLIECLKLEPHPEGGRYRRSYVSKARCVINDQERSLGSAIYYLLQSTDFSAWHRLDADELLHFYSGSSVTVHSIDEAGQIYHVAMGDPADNPRYVPQHLVPNGYWFALEVNCENSYALLGATVFPEFLFENFELGKGEQLAQQFPQHHDIIKRLTRE